MQEGVAVLPRVPQSSLELTPCVLQIQRQCMRGEEDVVSVYMCVRMCVRLCVCACAYLYMRVLVRCLQM